MSKAVKLKGHQQSKLRTVFDGWPSYFQHSMFMQDSVISARSLSFQERLDAALSMKDKGNECCGKGEMEEAIAEYEKALAIFVYCENQDVNWKKKGIEDKDIRVIEYIAQDQVSQKRLNALKVACYLNIALCKFRLKDFRTCLRACDDTLKIDERNLKALYRSAQALITPLSAGALEFDQAIQRLKRAYSIDTTNTDTSRLLKELQQQKRRQQITDHKTFGGMFDRGQLYREEELQKPQEKDGGRDAKDDFEVQIRQAQDLARLYEHKGEHDQAETIRSTIAKVKSERTKRRVDFLRPTPEMIEDAKRNNIDLTDKNVQRMLSDLHQGKDSLSEETKHAIDTENQVDTIMRSMSVEAIGQLLQQEGIPYHHLRDKEEILKLARHVIQSKLCGPLKDSSQYGESSYIKWVVICALVWTVLRLIASGNLSLLQGFLG
ncbi:unnamed protein product [Albugo candida]|nr:unnamed protein product [Albugo candida]|eukprot:CCI42454.1 unnamed protein product [Albugo candida]